MSVLQKAIESGEFTVTAEMAPPKGTDFSEQLAAARLLEGRVHAVNVTDMQSACLKASSLGLCVHLKQAGLEPILQITGRDRSRMAIMGDVLSAASFGIDTILALTGDHPVVGDCKDSKPVYDLDSVGILRMLSNMESAGTDCGGNPLTGGAPQLFKGAAVTPVYEPRALQINKLRQKVEAGARYIQTQGVFDLAQLEGFLEDVEKAGKLPPCLTMSFAAYIAFFSNDVQRLDDKGLVCRRPKGNEYVCSDDRWALEFYYDHRGDSPEELVHAVMTNERMWGRDLTEVDGFEAAVVSGLKLIREQGAKAAYAACL